MPKQRIELKVGQVLNLKVEVPTDFEIVTKDGTEISGTVLPNVPLRLKCMGDLARVDIRVKDLPEEQLKRIK